MHIHIRNARVVTLFFLLATIFIFSGCKKKSIDEKSDMVFIPEGSFFMGSKEIDKNSFGKEFGVREGKLFENAKPIHEVFLKGFFIDIYEVTIEEYKNFVVKTGHAPPPNWGLGMNIQGRKKYPVTVVSWYDAVDYCKWFGKRLPSEQEWEKAARGPNNFIYPWGNIYDDSKANLKSGDTMPVGSMKEDKSGYGAYDMGGNVVEWTNSWYLKYPGSTFTSDFLGEKFKVVRGGAGNVVGHYVLGVFDAGSSFRDFHKPTGKGSEVGFRCAKSPKT